MSKSFLFKFGGKINKVQSEGLIIFSFREGLTYPMHVSPQGYLKKNVIMWIKIDSFMKINNILAMFEYLEVEMYFLYKSFWHFK